MGSAFFISINLYELAGRKLHKKINFSGCCIFVAEIRATNRRIAPFSERGFKIMALTSKETEFCRQYAVLRNAREAAVRAGYVFPEAAGLKLLCRPQINERIEAFSEHFRRSAEAADGLRRIAFGSVADAVKLILSPEVAAEADELDLFMISEIKLPKSGGIELKFFDRIKALEALGSVSDSVSENGAVPFINAIIEGAAAISDGKKSDGDEL